MLETKLEKVVALRGLQRTEEAAALASLVYEGRVHRLDNDHPRTAEALGLLLIE